MSNDDGKMPLRSFSCPDDLWDDAEEAAELAEKQEGQYVSKADIVRRGLRREVRVIRRREKRRKAEEES